MFCWLSTQFLASVVLSALEEFWTLVTIVHDSVDSMLVEILKFCKRELKPYKLYAKHCRHYHIWNWTLLLFVVKWTLLSSYHWTKISDTHFTQRFDVFITPFSSFKNNHSTAFYMRQTICLSKYVNEQSHLCPQFFIFIYKLNKLFNLETLFAFGVG